MLLCLGVRNSLSRPRHKMGLCSGVSIWEWPVVIGGSDRHVSISYKEITDPFNILTLHEFPEVAFVFVVSITKINYHRFGLYIDNTQMQWYYSTSYFCSL